MPKVSIYIPDSLYDEIRQRGLPLSQVAQRAFRDALSTDSNAEWIAAARRRPVKTSTIDTETLMDAVDAEFGA